MNTQLIRSKIKDGSIKSWPDVYGYTTAREMADKLGRSAKHWETCRADPMKLTIGDMGKFIEAVGITKVQFLRVVEGVD